MSDGDGAWPPLPVAAWEDTRDTLHLWTQIVGKVRLGLEPWMNHSWHIPLYVNARGLTTSLMPVRRARRRDPVRLHPPCAGDPHHRRR